MMEGEAEFVWKEQPQVLRDLVKNLSVLSSCIFEIHDAPGDGTVDGDKPFVRVLGEDAFRCAAVHLHYVPKDIVKHVPGPLLIKVELRRLKNWLLKKVLPNGYSATLRRFARSPEYLHGVFQKGSTVRRRTLVLDRIDPDEVKGMYVFNQRWRIALPLQLFRCEMQSAVEAASHSSGRKSSSSTASGGSTPGSQPRAKVSFELRRDARTKATYFGILQDSMGKGNDLWLPAPMKEAVDGQEYVEFTVSGDDTPAPAPLPKDGGLSAALAGFGVPQLTLTGPGGPGPAGPGPAGPGPGPGPGAEDPMAAYKNMYQMDYSKMQPIFTGMVFSGAYLNKFVENIDGTDFINLVLSPDMPGHDGVLVEQPLILEHTAGSYAKFRFLLARDDAQEDEEEEEEEEDKEDKEEEDKEEGDKEGEDRDKDKEGKGQMTTARSAGKKQKDRRAPNEDDRHDEGREEDEEDEDEDEDGGERVYTASITQTRGSVPRSNAVVQQRARGPARGHKKSSRTNKEAQGAEDKEEEEEEDEDEDDEDLDVDLDYDN